jgi:hypothetical protein
VRDTGVVPTESDAYRTLGLAPGATVAEIRIAYRRLAKANHPDAAGEKNLPRFLAIQAAYEQLNTGRSGARGATRGPAAARATPKATPREPWRAQADRARTAREGQRTRPEPNPGARRRPPAPDGTEPRRPPSGRKRPSNKATLGSTTYDVAEDEPFEPEWSGGTWYGATSGTYWTLNPKEYADPRKHGPEYQRRARRAAGSAAGADATIGDAAEADPIDPTEAPPLTGAWAYPDDAETAGPRPETGAAPGDAGRGYDAPADFPDAQPDEARHVLPFAIRGGFPARAGLALVGWPPIGVAISTIAGEVTGCGRFSAACVQPFELGTWLAQLAVILVLLAVPAVAALSAVGTLAALATAVPTAVILSAGGGARQPETSAAILGGVMALAYIAGVAFAAIRRQRLGRVPWPR